MVKEYFKCTKERLDFIRKNRKKLSDEEMAGILKTTKYSVASARVRYNIKKPNFNKGRKRTEECKKQNRERQKGKHWSPTTEFKKGHPALKTAFKNSHISWKTGKTAKEDSRIPSGSKHYNWKNGITPKNKLIRQSLKFKEWKKAVFERDNYTCQNSNCKFCYNKKGGNLHAHHIKPFSKYSKLRFKVKNGITLCRDFHKQIKGKEEKYIKIFQDKIEKIK